MSEDRKVSSVKVYAKTDDASVLKVNALTFQENTDPKPTETVYAPTPYQGWDYDADEWTYDGDVIEPGMSLVVDPTTKTGFGWAMGGATVLNCSIGGRVFVSNNVGPAMVVPRAGIVKGIYSYSRAGTFTAIIHCGPITTSVGSVLEQNDILSVNIVAADVDCQDVTVQVRF